MNHDDGGIDIHYLHPLPTNVGHTYHHSITLRYTHTFLFPISSFYTIHTHMVGQCEVCVRIDHPMGNDMFSGGREGGSQVSGHRET